MTDACQLTDRALICISGSDAHGWLQGLVTNDIDLLSSSQALYAALLSPQGKILFDFFLVASEDDILIDCEAERRDELIKRLALYRLRSSVSIEPSDELSVFALFGEDSVKTSGLSEQMAGIAEPAFSGIAYVDPRLARMGARIVGNSARVTEELDIAGIILGPEGDYHSRRLSLGISNGARDLVPEKSFALESNLEEMNGVSFSKGCFIGQEVTARTKHKSKLRKRILPFQSTSALPQSADSIRAGASEIGTVLSAQDRRGLGLIRLDRWEAARESGENLMIDGKAIEISLPYWLETGQA